MGASWPLLAVVEAGASGKHCYNRYCCFRLWVCWNRVEALAEFRKLIVPLSSVVGEWFDKYYNEQKEFIELAATIQ